jgi:cytochrome b561
MAAMVTLQPHGALTRAIHWGIAFAVLAAWVVGSTMEDVPRGASRDLAMQLHYSLGVLVLGLAALRVAWRVVAPPARPPGAAWQRMAGQAMHLALIGLTVAVPMSGLLDRWARGRTVSVFGGIVLPAPFPVPGDRLWGEVHEALANLMLLLIAVHVLAALWHQFVLRDRTLSRMLPMLRG